LIAGSHQRFRRDDPPGDDAARFHDLEAGA